MATITTWLEEMGEDAEEEERSEQEPTIRIPVASNVGGKAKRGSGLPWSNRALTFKRGVSEQLPGDADVTNLLKYLKYGMSNYGRRSESVR